MVQIAVLGYGTVGSGVVEVLNTNKNSIAKKTGEEIQIKYMFCSFIMMVTALIFWIHRDIRISRRILTVH